MKIIVGLGNPGKKFEKTRHNVGARIVKELSSLNLENVILAEPTTFMNDSGRAVKKLVKRYKLHVTRLWVIHDDLDIPLSKIRISVGRGSAGHKGVQSIIDELGTKDFVRFRIGIKPERGSRKLKAEKFVLQKFSKDEEKIAKKTLKEAAGAIDFAIKYGVEKAMSKYNG